MAVEAVGDVLHAFTGPEGIPYLLDQCPVVLMQSSSFGFNRLLHGLPHLLEPLETPEPRWIRDGATRHHPRDRTGPGPFDPRPVPQQSQAAVSLPLHWKSSCTSSGCRTTLPQSRRACYRPTRVVASPNALIPPSYG